MRAFAIGFFLTFTFLACDRVFAQSGSRLTWIPDAVFLQDAAGEHTHAYCGGVQWRLRESLRIGHHMDVSSRFEVVAGRWRAQTSFDSDAHRWTNQIGLVPTIRLVSNSLPDWYIDTGVGPSYLTPRFHNKDKSFSSRFQFRSHIGIGIQIGTGSNRRRHHDIAFRIEHFSNAGYVKPNPGVNLAAVRYTYSF
jgi:lipid A 3-O-deacylase